jgi:hypothetical protein
MQKPDKYLRIYPLEIVVPVSKTLCTVLCFDCELIWPDLERKHCVCRNAGNKNMLGCEMCYEWYHGGCLGLKTRANKAAEAHDKDWMCGFCAGDEDDEGNQAWVGRLASSVTKSKRAKLTRNVADTPRAQGLVLDSPEYIAAKVLLWEEIIAICESGGKKIRLEEKKLKDKAQRAIARGGHHVVDALGNGGVELRPVSNALVDELLVSGVIAFEDEEVDNGLEILDDE